MPGRQRAQIFFCSRFTTGALGFLTWAVMRPMRLGGGERWITSWKIDAAPAGDCEMSLRYGSRCSPNNLRQGPMVPLHGAFLREVRPKLGPPEMAAPSLKLKGATTTATSQSDPPCLVARIMRKLSPKRRSALAWNAAQARWEAQRASAFH